MSRIRLIASASLIGSLLVGSGHFETHAQTPAPQGEQLVSVPIPPQARIGAQPAPVIAAAPAAAPTMAGEAADTGTVTVYFATNRDPVPEVIRPDDFGNELGNTTLFGSARLRPDGANWTIEEIVIEGGNVNRALAAPELLAESASEAGPTPEMLGIEAAGPLATFAAEAAAPASDVIAFIHGAGHSFESAVIDAARLAQLYGREGHPLIPLVFSYPSNGHSTVSGYFADRRDAGMSGLAMAEGFRRMLSFLAEVRERRPLGRQALVVHSLGAFAARQAVQAIQSGGLPNKKVFDVALIMAGDEDADTLSSDGKLRPLLQFSDAVVAYFADNDVLMRLSTLANFRRPIGRQGPSNLTSGDFGGVQVQAIDATAFAAVGDFGRAHSYFLRSPRAAADAKAVFAGTAPDEIPGRQRLSERLYRLVAEEAPATVTIASEAEPTGPEAPIYVFTRDPTAEAPIVALTAGSARELALGVAGRVRNGDEILPGRFDEVMVLAPSAIAESTAADDAGGVVVQMPSKAFLDLVLPRGFVSESMPTLAAENAGESGTLRLELGRGLTVLAQPIRPTLEENLGLTTWSGRVVAKVAATGETEPATGSVSLVYDEAGVSGTATVDGKIFEIIALDPAAAVPSIESGGLAPAALSRVEDVSGEPVLDDELPREGEEPGDGGSLQEVPGDQRGANDTVPGPEEAAGAAPVVELLIAFTPDAAQKVGDMRRAAAEYVERSNLSLDMANIPGRVKALAAEMVTGTEAHSGQTDLNRLRSKSDGHFDEVHGRRETLKADGVALVVADSDIAGFAGSNVGAGDAFLVVRSDHAGRHFSLIHEVGHWSGGAHARGANVPAAGWVSVMKHMGDAACPQGFCRRDGLWTDAPRMHPIHGFTLGVAGNSNAPLLRVDRGLPRISNFR